MKILVLGGGLSPERDVSLRSAASVSAAAKTAGFDVQQVDPKNGLAILDSLEAGTIIFPILHGAGGEDGVLQAELEKRKLPFLGSGSESSKNCFDKLKSRHIFEENGIPMPVAAEVTSETYKTHRLSKVPHVLKIVHGGSSIGTLIVRDPGRLSAHKVSEIFAMENHALIEELVEGVEITVPVLDTKALPVIEVIPPPSGEFDYENKYNGDSQELVPPKHVSLEIQKQAQNIAEETHSIMGCRHLSRTDFMLDKRGGIYALEINTMPGLTDQSLYPKSAAVAGYDMPELIKKFVDLVQKTNL